jgi:hypothetical protein
LMPVLPRRAKTPARARSVGLVVARPRRRRWQPHWTDSGFGSLPAWEFEFAGLLESSHVGPLRGPASQGQRTARSRP